MFAHLCVIQRGFASAAGSDKPRVFFGLTRQYSLRDRRIKSGPPQPRKVPFHRIGVAPPGNKYFCRDFKNPTTDVSNATFTIEYRPFVDIDMAVKTEQALKGTLPGCVVKTIPIESSTEGFTITRELDSRVVFALPPGTASSALTLHHLRELVENARRY